MDASFMRQVEYLKTRLAPYPPSVTDPLSVAIEGLAALIERTSALPYDFRQNEALRAHELLPSNATEFEKGLIVGLALAFMTEKR